MFLLLDDPVVSGFDNRPLMVMPIPPDSGDSIILGLLYGDPYK
jgi:hypothetical protein